MNNEMKNWNVQYSHSDGRSGSVKVTTEIYQSGAFEYGNKKAGALTADGYTTRYDLRYNHEKNLHAVMLKAYFGEGLVKATEI